MQHKFCNNCGTELVPGAEFCDNCGQKVEDEHVSKEHDVKGKREPGAHPPLKEVRQILVKSHRRNSTRKWG